MIAKSLRLNLKLVYQLTQYDDLSVEMPASAAAGPAYVRFVIRSVKPPETP